MNRIPAVDGYLKAHEGGQEPRVRPFITISRQAGAGGHLLAAALLEVFAEQDDVELFGGWQVFDRKLCEIVASDRSYSSSMDALAAEHYRTRTDDFLHQLLGSAPDQDRLMFRVFRVVSAVASIGKCIIVGRAGSELTRDMGPSVHVRLVAPEQHRIAGVMAHYGLDERAARAEMRRLDSSRARLLKSHFRVDIDDPLRYDVVWNTGRIPIRAIAEAVAVTLRHQVSPAAGDHRR